MIKKLELKNYRVYDEYVMEFGALELIKGRNGIGKTSIVEAIGFALFGSALQRGKAGNWVKEGQKDGSVRLYIDDFIITRSTSLSIVEDLNGNILARNNTGIVEWVENEYGLTPELYKTSFYIGQKDIGAFAALSPMERTKRVEKLLRIDRLDQVKDTAKDKARTVTSNLNLYVGKLEGAEFDQELLDSKIEELVILEVDLNQANNTLEKLLVAQGEYNQALAQWRTKLSLQDKFKGKLFDIDILEKEYQAIVEHNATVDQTNKTIREKVILERKLKSTNISEDYFNIDIRDVMTQETLLKTYKRLKTEYDKLEKENIEPLKCDLDISEQLVKDLKHKLELNSNVPETCPTCKQDWPTKITVNLDELRSELADARASLELEKLSSRMHEINQGMMQAHEQLTMNEQEIETALDSIQHKESYLRLQELKDVPEELQDKKTTDIDLDYARAQNDYAARIEEMKDVVEPEEVNVAVVKKEISDIKSNIHFATEIVSKHEKAKAIYQEYAGLREDAEVMLNDLKNFIRFIDQYRKSFGANVIPLLEANVSNIVAYLSEGKYDKVKINTDYSIDNFDFYSGSEQDSISFALRLAIAQVSRLGKFKTMLLDEIAASFDGQREELLMDILKQQSNQLIYITHGDI